jgi:hypothetical protein
MHKGILMCIGKTTGLPEEFIKLGTLSANAAVSEKWGHYWYHDIIRKCRCEQKTGTSLVPHYPQMPPSVKNGNNTGTTLSANVAISEKREHYWYYIICKCSTQ